MPKSWIEKRDCEKSYQIKIINKTFADIPEGSKMLIVSPPIIDDYIKNISFSRQSDLKTMRKDLALTYNAHKTCPVNTGIFLRIVDDAAYEEFLNGQDIGLITPFWRVVQPGTKLAHKLACGNSFIVKHRINEGIEIQ